MFAHAEYRASRAHKARQGMQIQETPGAITVVRRNHALRDDNRHVRTGADVLRGAAMSFVAGV